MNQYIEVFGKVLRPEGTEQVAEMPYGCTQDDDCKPYLLTFLPGQYKIQLWGASGGSGTSTASSYVQGGLGGYVTGIMNVVEKLPVYFYVGSMGNNSYTNAYNGGGAAGGRSGDRGISGGGGGATDARIYPDFYEAEKTYSLNSRLIVAGAGGGITAYMSGHRGGHNLGTEGEKGYMAKYNNNLADTGTVPSGGSQTAGGSGFWTSSGGQGSNGSLGIGGDSESYSGGGGGGGYYGGGGGGWSQNMLSSGAGGSSFVNGHPNCGTKINLQSFIETEIIGGLNEMPSPYGLTEVGHYGNGYARVTVISGGFILPESKQWKHKTGNYIFLVSTWHYIDC